MNKSIGLYIHIPFCKSKCPYCDFFSQKACEDDFEDYTDVLIEKIILWSRKVTENVSTIYFGGGTPSIFGAERLCRILNAVMNNFDIDNNAEITVEINPDSGKTMDFAKLKECGFNRLSIGMQSSIAEELRILGRIHSAEDARLTVARAQKACFENISLDLMMGIPIQSIESLKESIMFCDYCKVSHISSYILKIEENTKFYNIKEKLSFPDEDKQAEIYLEAVGMLENLGYKQYEISNFAREGFESRHNINYWKCGEYIGIGPSAHSFYKGKRFYYDRNMKQFENDVIISDGNGGGKEEFIMLSLRLKSGLRFDEYKNKFASPLPCCLIQKAEYYAKSGFMEVDKDRICFTPKGFLVSNTIISNLI